MTTMPDQTTEAPVRKSITVRTDVEHAFRVFTEGIDDWWPRAHHIGKAPMKKILIEGKAGGRCYSEQTDGTDCDWGSVLVWDPPRRLVIAWQITPAWGTSRISRNRARSKCALSPSPGAAPESISSTDISIATAPASKPSGMRWILPADGPAPCSSSRRERNEADEEAVMNATLLYRIRTERDSVECRRALRCAGSELFVG